MGDRRPTHTSSLAGLLAIGLACLLGLLAVGAFESVLLVAPFLLVAAPLAFGYYLGEGAITALRDFFRPRAGTPPRVALPRILNLARKLAQASLFSGRGPPLALR